MLYKFRDLLGSKQKFTIGKKAESLLTLVHMGVNVPDGAIIPDSTLQEYMSFNQMNQYIARLHTTGYTNVETCVQEAKLLREKIIAGKFPDSVVTEISAYLEQHLGARFAIRSSANKEDLADSSFAGLYKTVLNLQGLSTILEGIKTCWASLFDERVIQYCLNKSISLETISMPLILQHMIPAEKSGVIFTVNPVTGADKEMVIEACFGLGEGLMTGVVTPDQYYYNWFNKSINYKSIQQQETAIIPIDQPPFTKTISLPKAQQSAPVLEDSELKTLAEQAVAIQVGYGFPVDIEWVKYSNQFFFVQSRPITSINYQGIKGEWTTANFRDGGVSSDVCSAFMWSLYDYIWEVVMPQYLKEINILLDHKVPLWGDMFFGRPYWNLGEVKNCLRKLPRFVERDFDEDLGIEIVYNGDGQVTKFNLKTIFQGIKVLLAIQLKLRRATKSLQLFRQQQIRRLEELEKIEPASMLWEQFVHIYDTLIQEDYFCNEAAYFQHVFSTSNVTTLFKTVVKKVNLDVSFLDLVSGLTGVSHLEQNYGIWDISRKILADKDAKQFWLETSVDELVKCWKNKSNDYLMDEVTEFVQRFAYRSARELDITVPRFGEDPSLVIQSIKNSLSLDESANPRKLNKRQHNNFLNKSTAFKKALPFYKSLLLMKSLAQLREFLWWREELRDLSTRYYYYIRKFTLALVPYFKGQGIVNDEQDIFHFSKEHILQVLSGKINVRDAKVLLERNKAYYQSFRNFRNPSEIGGKYNHISTVVLDTNSVTGNNLKLQGIPCSPGEVVGKVKIIKDVLDAERLEEGDILVTKFTDPSWTSKFNLLKAVATETGGILSHTAVISREYGIPAVLAIKGLTEKLIEGQHVRINGSTGIIDVLDIQETY